MIYPQAMQEKLKHQAIPTSVFVLQMKYCEEVVKNELGKVIYPIQLKTETIGFFTDIKKVEFYITFPMNDLYQFTHDYPFKIFELHELNQVNAHVKTIIYDASGNVYSEHCENTEEFRGREEEDCRFKVNDVVEYIDDDKLKIGKIAGMPPDKKWMKKISERPKKSRRTGVHLLDGRDDSYLINDDKKPCNRSRVRVSHVFEPSVKVMIGVIILLFGIIKVA